MKAEKPKVTHPHTPQLMTRQRSRPVSVKSAAEIEAEEVEKLQQYVALDYCIFSRSSYKRPGGGDHLLMSIQHVLLNCVHAASLVQMDRSRLPSGLSSKR